MAGMEGMGAFALPQMTVLSGLLDYASKSSATRAMVLSAQRKKLGADYAAAQLDVNAGQQEAASQVGATEQQRQGELGLSRIQALAAMQGGSTNDPTVVGIRGRMMAEAAYRSSLELYKGAEAARGMRAQAEATRYMGNATMADANAAKFAGDLAATSSVIKTGTMLAAQNPQSLGGKYNFDGPGNLDNNYQLPVQYMTGRE